MIRYDRTHPNAGVLIRQLLSHGVMLLCELLANTGVLLGELISDAVVLFG